MTAGKRSGRLRRWLVRGAVVLVVLVLVLRLVLAVALEPIAARVARSQGLDLRWEELDLSLLAGDVVVRRLDVRPLQDETAADGDRQLARDPRDALLHVEYAEVDVAVLALLRGDLRVHRLEVDGLDATLARDASGAWNIPGLGGPGEEPAPAEPEDEPETQEDAGPRAPPLGSPVAVDALRAQRLSVRYTDATVDPPLDLRLLASLGVSDLGTSERPTRIELLASAPGALELLRVEGGGRTGGPDLDLTLDVELLGFGPGALRGLLRLAGLEPVARSLGATAGLRVTGEPVVEAVPEGEDEPEPHAVRLALALEGVALTADGDEAAALDALSLDVPELTTRSARVAALELTGLRAHAERRPDGTLRAAGFDLVPVAAPAEPPEPEPEPGPAGPPFVVSVERLRLADGELALLDRAVEPETRLELGLEELVLRDVVIDPSSEAPPAPLEARIAVPGVLRSLELAGQVDAAGPELGADLRLAAEGVTAERLAPYLAALGLESTLEDGRLALELRAAVEQREDAPPVLGAELSGVTLTDGERELAAFGGLRLEGLVADAEAGRLRVEALDLAGLRLPARREASGALALLGLRTVAAPPPATSGSAPEPPPRPDPGAPAVAPAPDPGEDGEPALQRIEVGRLTWSDSRLAFRDETFDPPVELDSEGVQVSIADLALGEPAPGTEATPARVRVALAARELADELVLEGTIAAQPGALAADVDLVVRGRGLTTRAVEPWLARAGVESELADASLDLALAASFEQGADDLRASLTLQGLELSAPDGPLIALQRLAVDQLRAGADGLSIASVEVEGPTVGLEREADGTLVALGLRLPPARAGGASGPVPAPAAAVPAPEEPAEPAPPPRFELGSLRWSGARVAWRDAAVEPAVDTALELTVRGDQLVLGPADDSGTLQVELAVDGVLDALTVDGRFALDPDDTRVELSVSAEGLRAGPLASYLPPGVEAPLEAGRAGLRLDAQWAVAPEGGRAARLELSDLVLADGERELMRLDHLLADAPRIDPDGGAVTVAEISTAGLALDARRRADGAVELLGIALAPPPPAPAPATAEPPPEDDGATSAEPELPAASPPREGPLPTVRVEALDVGLERLRFVDETAGSVPLEVSLRLAAPGPLVLLEPEPEDLPPIELSLTGHAQPVLGELAVDVSATPWAPDPRLTIDLALRGLRGQGLVEVLPELDAALDGTGLENGEVVARLDTTLRVRRRGPLALDLASGIGLESRLDGLALRAEPGGEPQLGFESLYVDVESLRPATGDVSIRTIELVKPIARVRKEADGVHVAGLVIKLPPPPEAGAAPAGDEAKPSESSAPPPSPRAPVEATAKAPAPPPAARAERDLVARERRTGEVRVGELLVAGSGLELVDASVDPPVRLPIEDVDLELRGFSSRMTEEPRTVQLRAVVTGGKIPLPERHEERSLLRGLAGATVGALTGGNDEYEIEQRPAFDEISIDGRVQLVPELRGWGKLGVVSMELVNFRGAARDAGVEIGDGVLDTTVRARVQSHTLSVNTSTQFAYLSISEPPGGPISRYLRLPAPLDSVLFVLRNQDGDVHVPLGVTMPEGDLSTQQVTSEAVKALGAIIADALKSSPMRLLGSVTDTVGLGGLFGDDAVDLSGESRAVVFAPGATSPDAEQLEGLRPLRRLMADDDQVAVVLQHEFGRADIERIATLANPSPQQVVALTRHLRQRKARLAEERAGLAATAASEYLVGTSASAQDASLRVRALDRETAELEDALDSLYELLRPGAERRADRRTRTAALEIARQRLAAVQQVLLESGLRAVHLRVDVRRPRYGDPELDGGGRVTLTPKVRQKQ